MIVGSDFTENYHMYSNDRFFAADSSNGRWVSDGRLAANYYKELPVLRAEIHALYTKLDKRLGLSGADVPITFTENEEQLGSYTPPALDREEHFSFTLPFIAYSSRSQLQKSDREDLYLHEYAHYMRHTMDIPTEYDFESGPHGSAWRYCCSLINAVPSAYYKVGESLKKQNYNKALKNNWKDNAAKSRMLDTYHRTQESRAKVNSVARFKIGEEVKHPKFGFGIVEDVEETPSSVRLRVRFGEEVKLLDQKWLMKANIQ